MKIKIQLGIGLIRLWGQSPNPHIKIKLIEKLFEHIKLFK